MWIWGRVYGEELKAKAYHIGVHGHRGEELDMGRYERLAGAVNMRQIMGKAIYA